MPTTTTRPLPTRRYAAIGRSPSVSPSAPSPRRSSRARLTERAYRRIREERARGGVPTVAREAPARCPRPPGAPSSTPPSGRARGRSWPRARRSRGGRSATSRSVGPRTKTVPRRRLEALALQRRGARRARRGRHGAPRAAGAVVVNGRAPSRRIVELGALTAAAPNASSARTASAVAGRTRRLTGARRRHRSARTGRARAVRPGPARTRRGRGARRAPGDSPAAVPRERERELAVGQRRVSGARRAPSARSAYR